MTTPEIEEIEVKEWQEICRKLNLRDETVDGTDEQAMIRNHFLKYFTFATKHQEEVEKAVRKTSYEIVKEFQDNLITIAINNEHLRGCVTSNQINQAFKDFEASTHEALTPTTDKTTESLDDK